MQAKKKQGFLSFFFEKDNLFPIISAIAAGLYPLLFYYTNNYKLINSWGHFGYFISLFILLPILVFFIANKVSEITFFRRLRSFKLPFLNFFFFFFFLNIALYAGFSWLRTFMVFVIASLLTFLFWKHFKKIIAFQFILAVIGIFTLTPVIIKQLNYSKEWMIQPDGIETAVFKKKPNIYFIQPDGYVNFSEMKKGNYNIENTAFETFLTDNNFKNYPNFRSNYGATLPTNSSLFMMKHHYYNNGSDFTETIDARTVIVSDNSVLRILKNNGYRTFLLTEQPYFLTNKPKLGYDFCNFSTEEISFVTTGLGNPRDVIKPFEDYLETYSEGPNFFFVEIFNPGHIINREAKSKGIAGEREHYIESLKEADKKLTALTKTILNKDPEALIIIMADHGGFVGMKSVEDSYTKSTDPDLVNSIFSSILAIHWPNGEAPKFDNKLKTSVNLFRILTSYLSENDLYLANLQPDESYIIINFDAPQGVYEYINGKGNVVFKKY